MRKEIKSAEITYLGARFDITGIHLRGVLGGQADDMSFDATVKGLLKGKPFRVSLDASNFPSFIQAVFKWLVVRSFLSF